MTKEDVIAYLKENPLKDISPEEFVDELLRDGQILMSDYLELQKAIEFAKKPILEIKLSPEQMVWDIEKWLFYSEPAKVIFTEKTDMTREETVSFIRAYPDGDTAIGNIIPIRDVLESAITYLTEQPFLPAGLDEAAVQAHIQMEESGEEMTFLNTFKAGAKWRDAQIPKLPDNLEDAAEKYFYSQWSDGSLDIKDDVIADFIAGAEYQRKQDQSLIELAEDHAMLAGMNKMKEEMMERAVDADVNTYKDLATGESWAEFVVKMPTKNLGDKVKVIVIPEEK